MKVHDIVGGGGIRLHVREWGEKSAPPILFIHGWSQNHLCWTEQFTSELQEKFRLVALDLRGHGMSEAPAEPGQYTDGDKWADDIAAVVEGLGLRRPLLVGWSYGGFIIADYIRRYGQERISGINFVAAAVVLGSKAFGPLIGPGFFEHAPGTFDSDLPTSILAVRKFLHRCFVKPLSAGLFETALAFNMVVPAKVRAFLVQRELDFAPILANITVPVLVTHGRADTVVMPAMSDYILTHCPNAKTSWYDGVGHAPFLEEPRRFNRELAEFGGRAFG
jgi:pimeloyl-ACP methyl ester carboxylesterase